MNNSQCSIFQHHMFLQHIYLLDRNFQHHNFEGIATEIRFWKYKNQWWYKNTWQSDSGVLYVVRAQHLMAFRVSDSYEIISYNLYVKYILIKQLVSLANPTHSITSTISTWWRRTESHGWILFLIFSFENPIIGRRKQFFISLILPSSFEPQLMISWKSPVFQ